MVLTRAATIHGLPEETLMHIPAADSSQVSATTALMLRRLGQLTWLSIGLTAAACGLALMHGALAPAGSFGLSGAAAATARAPLPDHAATPAPTDGGFIDHSAAAWLPEAVDGEPGVSVAAYEHLPADTPR